MVIQRCWHLGDSDFMLSFSQNLEGFETLEKTERDLKGNNFPSFIVHSLNSHTHIIYIYIYI